MHRVLQKVFDVRKIDYPNHMTKRVVTIMTTASNDVFLGQRRMLDFDDEFSCIVWNPIGSLPLPLSFSFLYRNSKGDEDVSDTKASVVSNYPLPVVSVEQFLPCGMEGVFFGSGRVLNAKSALVVYIIYDGGILKTRVPLLVSEMGDAFLCSDEVDFVGTADTAIVCALLYAFQEKKG